MTQPTTNAPAIRTLGELRTSGYRPRSVKRELRENTAAALARGEELFPGVRGYEDTTIPEIASALLSEHDLLLLGLRGQAKTRILRSMVHLLDEWIPVIAGEGVELRDDPMDPRTTAGRSAVEELGDQTPVRWVHRSERYLEKLATPDVTIADLLGEIDLVKYARSGGSGPGGGLSDERTMHFGLIPRASRGLFVINELPDLSPRIQVGLFNVLEERDVQIRGYPVKLDLDVCLMFSANPEDYTNRGRIVTPLKDRIGSVVRTHYPSNNAEAMAITLENAFVSRHRATSARQQGKTEPKPTRAATKVGVPEVVVPPVLHEVIEESIRLARKSPHVNPASGVSVRASIAALENVVSGAEARGYRCGESRVMVRPCDLAMVVPAVRGKIELMLSEDGAGKDGKSTEDRLIEALVGEAIKQIVGRKVNLDSFESVAEAFKKGLRLELGDRTGAAEAVASMKLVPGLMDAAGLMGKAVGIPTTDDDQAKACCGELVLEVLYVNNRVSKRGGEYSR